MSNPEWVPFAMITLNWVDYLIILVGIYYIFEGYSIGFVAGAFDVVGYIGSFIAGLKLYQPLGDIITNLFHVSQSITHIVAFIIAAIAVEFLLQFFHHKITNSMRKSPFIRSLIIRKLNNIFGIFTGVISGAILIAFFLTVLIVFPVSVSLKQSITHSTFGSNFVSQTQGFEKNITEFLGGKPDNLLTFFTIEPQTISSIDLHFTKSDGVPDPTSEQQMLLMVNHERERVGLADLMFDKDLQAIARAHSQDMLARGYFSHFTPEGKSPFDRMSEANITFIAAGENLAFSANVTLAMQGLMASPGHRANILSPNFHRIGIGVIDAGVYGEMFSQEFTN